MIDYRENDLYIEDVRAADIAAEFGTPCYVYSRTMLIAQWKAFDAPHQSHPHRVCFAVKANSNLAVLATLAAQGSGFDIVSVGELERVLAAKGDPAKIVFSGVGKQAHEIIRALEVGVGCFNVESRSELDLLNKLSAKRGTHAPVALRINPDVDAGTHPYISTGLKENKFGIPIADAVEMYRYAANLPAIKIRGIAFHIGSQLLDLAPITQALASVLEVVNTLAREGITLTHIDVGGGLGVRYRDEQATTAGAYVKTILDQLKNTQLEIFLEPGRAIAASAGVLLTKTIALKTTPHKHFAIVDAAMNDLLRPALYDAWQEIVPVQIHAALPEHTYDVVGPVCESSDFLGLDRPLKIQEGDLLAIKMAGAYGAVMSSNYNTRPRACEVMVAGNKSQCIREREQVKELFSGEDVFRK